MEEMRAQARKWHGLVPDDEIGLYGRLIDADDDGMLYELLAGVFRAYHILDDIENGELDFSVMLTFVGLTGAFYQKMLADLYDIESFSVATLTAVILKMTLREIEQMGGLEGLTGDDDGQD